MRGTRTAFSDGRMHPSSRPTAPVPFRKWRKHAQRGLTLVEIMISLGILALTSVGGVSAFLLLNRYASNARSVTAAKELCQERIEQAQTMTYVPTANTPSVTGQTVNGTSSGPFKILGNAYTDASPNYDVNGQLLAGATATTTSSEPVNVYLKQETGTNVIAGTRTTTIALPTGLTDVTYGTQLKIVQFTVTVAWSFRGTNYSYSMYTLRSAD